MMKQIGKADIPHSYGFESRLKNSLKLTLEHSNSDRDKQSV